MDPGAITIAETCAAKEAKEQSVFEGKLLGCRL